jgi:hypothetical protein
MEPNKILHRPFASNCVAALGTDAIKLDTAAAENIPQCSAKIYTAVAFPLSNAFMQLAQVVMELGGNFSRYEHVQESVTQKLLGCKYSVKVPSHEL